jgi:hypothetical protein
LTIVGFVGGAQDDPPEVPPLSDGAQAASIALPIAKERSRTAPSGTKRGLNMDAPCFGGLPGVFRFVKDSTGRLLVVRATTFAAAVWRTGF